MLRKNRYVWKDLVISLLVYTGNFLIITNIPVIISYLILTIIVTINLQLEAEQ